MSVNVKEKKDEKEGKLLESDTVIKFSKEDFKPIRLKSEGKDGKVYVEHKHLADKLIKKGVAEEVKGVELEESKPNTQIL